MSTTQAIGQEEMMELWKKNATPGAGHKVLEPLVGAWTYTMRWWGGPDSQAEESQGTADIRWILNGRYLQQTVKGTAMGQPMEGIEITSYSNPKQEYTSIWIDSMGTTMMVSSGTWNPSQKKLTEKGASPDIASGNMNRPFRAVTTINDSNSHTYELFMANPDGKEFKSLEISYKRKK